MTTIAKTVQVVDVETYPNLFLVVFLDECEQSHTFELRGDPNRTFSQADRDKMRSLMDGCDRLITYNGRDFDLPLIDRAVKGDPLGAIIADAHRRINDKQQFPEPEQHANHIDLMRLRMRVQGGLKKIGANLHFPDLTELPFDPDQPIRTDAERAELERYCKNDCAMTLAVYQREKQALELREQLSATFPEVNFLPLPDSQLAERMMEAYSQEARTQKRRNRAALRNGRLPRSVRFKPQHWIRFNPESPHHSALRNLLEVYRGADFEIEQGEQGRGKVKTPQLIRELQDVQFGAFGEVRVGIGGMHSNPPARDLMKHKCNFTEEHRERGEVCSFIDASSYYPHLVLSASAEPFVGFRDLYREMVEARLDAKAQGDKTSDQALKIAINGTFGKLSSPFSSLYSPELFLQTTINGQMGLLMLLDELYQHEETHGVRVLQANTDGIYVAAPAEAMTNEVEQITRTWERNTGISLDREEVALLRQRDVNNYVAVFADGAVKAKGAYLLHGGDDLSRSPKGDIVRQAVQNHLLGTKSIIDTVMQADDLRDFLAVKMSKTGIYIGDLDHPLGKVVRTYRASHETPPLLVPRERDGAIQPHRLADAENSVAVGRFEEQAADGKVPIPDNLNRHHYIREANTMCSQLGDHTHNDRNIHSPLGEGNLFAEPYELDALPL